MMTSFIENIQTRKVGYITIIILIFVNIVLVVGLFFPNNEVLPQPEFIIASNLELEADEVFVIEITGDFFEAEDIRFTGTVLLVNDQNIPVADAVVTMQLVINNRTSQIDQFTTDENGIADYSFILEAVIPLWVEVLDVLGDEIQYVPYKNLSKMLISH